MYRVKMSDRVISFWTMLPEPYYRKLRAQCALKGCSLRDLAKEILMAYLDSIEPIKEEKEGEGKGEPAGKEVDIEG
jgi:plasmid stability protein